MVFATGFCFVLPVCLFVVVVHCCENVGCGYIVGVCLHCFFVVLVVGTPLFAVLAVLIVYTVFTLSTLSTLLVVFVAVFGVLVFWLHGVFFWGGWLFVAGWLCGSVGGMKIFVMLQGAPACGKSTVVREHGWEDFVVSPDSLRFLMGQAVVDVGGRESLSVMASSEAKLWDFVEFTLESRFRQGAFTVLDSTLASAKTARRLGGLALKHGYRVFVVNVQGDLTNMEILARNRSRTSGFVVADKAVLSAANRVRDFVLPAGMSYAAADEIDSLLVSRVQDFNGFERVVVVGDVQSCGRALTEMCGEFGFPAATPNTLFIFVGDLFDRGDDARTVFSIVCDENGVLFPNVILVEGNHERNLREVVNNVSSRRFESTRVSFHQILDGRGDTQTVPEARAAVDMLLSQTVPFVAGVFGEHRFFVCHGGVSGEVIDRTVDFESGVVNNNVLPDWQYIMGVCPLENTYRRSGWYSQSPDMLAHDSVVQFHGHRNGGGRENPYRISEVGNVFTLEQGVEYNGYLAVACLSHNSVSTHKFFESEVNRVNCFHV